MEVGNVLQAGICDLSEEGKVSIIKNWSGREGMQFIQTLTNAKKGACRSATGLFNVLKEKFWPQLNEVILSLQYSKLQRKESESAQEWMHRLNIKAADCIYKEHGRQLKEEFINDIYDEEITQVVIKELTAKRNTSEIDSEQVIMWLKGVEAQRLQMKALDEMKTVKDFDHIHGGNRADRDNEQQPKEQYKKLRIDSCMYCGASHTQRQCLAFGKT